jgi:hypothetical protein
VNFTVDAIEMHTISGMVTDGGTNQPVMAAVSAFATNAQGFTAKTDPNGNYTLTVPSGLSYYVTARDVNNEYYIQYYDHSASQTAATKVLVNGDMTGIDFELDKKPIRNNIISGTVLDENGNTVSGYVVAYRLDSRGSTVLYPVAAYKTMTDNTGYFEFTNLDPGTYVLQVLHTASNVVPGYYKDGEFAVRSWADATMLQVRDNSSYSGIIIKLDMTHGVRGNHMLFGNVRGKIGGFNSDEAPLEGVMVLLIDEIGKTSEFAVSDEEGNYYMSQAASGTFTLMADIPGYQTWQQTITLDYSNGEPQDMGIVLIPLSSTSVGTLPAVPNDISVGVFPNPSTSVLNLRFNEEVAGITINIYSALGKLIGSASVTEIGSGESLPISTAELPVGTYFIRIDGGVTHATIPFAVMR